MRNVILERPMFFLYAIIFVYLAIRVKDFKPSTQRICEYRCTFKSILIQESEFAFFLFFLFLVIIGLGHFFKMQTWANAQYSQKKQNSVYQARCIYQLKGLWHALHSKVSIELHKSSRKTCEFFKKVDIYEHRRK